MRGWVVQLLAGLCLMLQAGFAEAKWLNAETPHFVLYSQGSEKALREMAVTLEDYHSLLMRLTDTKEIEQSKKLEVYFVRSSSELRSVRDVGASAAGFYSATPGRIGAFAISSDLIGLSGNEILFHEYAHHFMMQYHATAYPAWYVEGFAEYMMTAKFKPKTIEFGGINPGRASWLVNGGWLHMRKILGSNVAMIKGAEGSMFYAQSWLAVHYLFNSREKTLAIGAFLEAQAKGEPREEAFKRALGTDYDGFNKQLQRYALGGLKYSIMDRASDRETVPVSISVLPPAAADFLLSRAALRLGADDKKGKEILARARALAPKYGEDPLAQQTLAQAEIAFGDRAIGRAILDKRIVQGKADAETLFLRGWAEVLDARDHGDLQAMKSNARPWFVKAYAVDPLLVVNLLAYVGCYPLSDLPASVFDVLVRAHELAPQVAQISVQTAFALMTKQRFEDAERLLIPIAADVHGSERMSGVVQTLLAAARAREVPEKLDWMPDDRE